MSQITEEIKSKAEVHYGNEICQERSKFLLTEMGLPNGLLPLEDIIECGWVKETGFVWLKQKKETKHMFEKIGKPVAYATEVTAIIEPKKIKKVTGVKAKELMIWVTVCDIFLAKPVNVGKITFHTPTGISRTFPVSAFEVEVSEAKDEVVVKEAAKEFTNTEAVARVEVKEL